MDFKQELAKLIEQQTPLTKTTAYNLLEVPPQTTLGDYALPCFALAKELKKSPAQIASELEQNFQAPILETTKANGPYLNFFLNKELVNQHVLNKELTAKKPNKTILFEYPSPNTNKPLHLGHLRNMLLGEATARICEHAGNNVIRTNLNNDRGVHICKSMLAYKKYGEGKTPADMNLKPDHFVGHWYVKFAQEAKKNPQLEQEAQQLLVKWEQGDQEARALWKQMNDWAHSGFQETYKRLGITFDKEYHESEFYEQAKQIVLEAHKKGVFETDEDNNIIAPLDEPLGDKVVLRADGTAIYATQDIGLAKQKQEDFSPDEQVYVVAEEQTHYFKQLFAIFDLLGMNHKRHHLSYGLISLPSGRMKSREGNVVDCDELLDEMQALAKQEIQQRHDTLAEEELTQRAKKIGQAALNFYMLKYEPKTGFVYNAEESISFEGETGPYIQYAAARITSILNEQAPPDTYEPAELNEELAYELITALRQTPQRIQQAAATYKPHIVARHALTIAQTFTRFYHEHRILDAPTKKRDARLALIQATKKHLEVLLNLLDIQLLDEM